MGVQITMTTAQFFLKRINEQERYIESVDTSDRTFQRKEFLRANAAAVLERFHDELYKLRSACKCEWQEEYYGVRCIKCEMFYPHGGAPWEEGFDDDDDDDSIYRTCEGCG